MGATAGSVAVEVSKCQTIPRHGGINRTRRTCLLSKDDLNFVLVFGLHYRIDAVVDCVEHLLGELQPINGRSHYDGQRTILGRHSRELMEVSQSCNRGDGRANTVQGCGVSSSRSHQRQVVGLQIGD